jgi:hypothetical protein
MLSDYCASRAGHGERYAGMDLCILCFFQAYVGLVSENQTLMG